MKAAIRRTILIGTVTAIVGLIASVVPQIDDLEESLGLRILYAVRGRIEPPPNVLIISVSDESVTALGLPIRLDDEVQLTAWPRRYYSEIISKLDSWGVGAIVFDVHFRDPGDPTEDAELASAMREAGSVVVFELHERLEHRSAPGAPGLPVLGYRDRLIPPTDEIAEAALIAAPFTVPAEPDMANWYQSFVHYLDVRPTLPTSALAVLAGDTGRWLLEMLAPPAFDADANSGTDASGLSQRLTAARLRARQDPGLVETLRSELESRAASQEQSRTAAMALALLEVLAGPETPFLYYYGPPQSIPTIPIHEVLTRDSIDEIDWKDTAVFIGFSSRTQPPQVDEFRTFYTQPSGLEINGVEIAATALGNQIEGTPLIPILMMRPLNYLLLVFMGLALGIAFVFESAKRSALLLALVFGLYLVAAQIGFNSYAAWLPIVSTVMIQAPLALFLGLALLYRQARAQHAAVTRGASLFLPADLLHRIEQDPDTVRASRLATGVCMVTDIQQYTAYSESVPPAELKTELDAYYETLFSIIKLHGGIVTDIVGDSMVAVWPGPDDRCREQAFGAALAVASRLGVNDSEFPRTRVGLQAGEFMLGAVGASERLEYRAVGDSVNSAARIQSLNKLLGTTVLAAREALPDSAPRRDLGMFQLPGKRRLIEICEPLTPGNDDADLDSRFAAGLAAFRTGHVALALDRFEALLVRHPLHGPSLFYASYLRQIDVSVAAAPDPVVRIPS